MISRLRSCRPAPRCLAVACAAVVLAGCSGRGGKAGTGAGGDGASPASPPAPETSGRVAFVSDSSANDDVFLLDLGTGKVTALTRNPSQDVGPSWSPDGARLAFSSSSLEGHLQIAVMNADGSGVKAITRCVRTDCTSDASPAWSPNGRLIAFGRLAPNGRFALDVMAPDGTGLRKVAEDRFAGGESTDVVAAPTWSPDGKRLAFENKHKIFVVGADGSGAAPLTSGPGNDFAPAWSPDGKRILFMSNREGGHFKIYSMSPDGSGVTRLTGDPQGSPPVDDANPAWSPRGTKIVFSRDHGTDSDIWVMNADGTSLQQLTLSRSTEDEPAWAPKS